MILTITMNPSIDHIYLIDDFKLGEVNRVTNPQTDIGGKGINAGRTASLSGADIALTGFIAGDNGEIVKHMLEDESFKLIDMIQVSGNTRNAVTIMHNHHTHTEIVEAGPLVDEQHIHALFNKINEIYQSYPIHVISINGSIHTNTKRIFLKLIKYIKTTLNQQIPILVDVSGTHMADILTTSNYVPDFIKPNIHELGEIFQQKFSDKQAVIQAIKTFDFNGIQQVLISCGSEGAIFKQKQAIYDITIPSIDIINPTGSGDATVGGYAYALEKNFPIEERLKYAMACGMSNAQNQRVGFIEPQMVKQFTKQIIVEKIH